jgi:hypothetical protein
MHGAERGLERDTFAFTMFLHATLERNKTHGEKDKNSSWKYTFS